MAISTSTTYANIILNEVLSERSLKALTPKVVAWNHCNQDSIDGERSLSKEYTKHADLGAAAAGSEGTDFTTITTLSLDTTVTMTPTEAAIARADLTTRAMRRAKGLSAGDVYGRLSAGDFSPIMDLLEEEAGRLSGMLYEKAESDTIALLDDFSDTAGSTGVDITVDNFLTALFKLEQNEPEHGEFVGLLDIEQIRTLRASLTSNAADADGAVWYQQADASAVNYINDANRNGLKGSLLGIPLFQLAASLSLSVNAGADVGGALIARGEGDPVNGLRGPINFLEGHPITFLVDFDPSARTVELIGIWEYAVAEVTDAHGVSIITDAP